MFVSVLTFLVLTTWWWCEAISKANIFKTQSGKVILVRDGVYHDLPDSETIRLLGFYETEATSLPDLFLSFMKKGDAIPTLKPANVWPDELMRVKIDKIATLDPAQYWVESRFLPGHTIEVGAYNPAMIRLADRDHLNKFLMCWRSGTKYSQLEFGWYHLQNNSVEVDTRMKVESVELGGKLSPMEDGRLFAVNDETIVSVFTGLHGHNADAVQLLSVGHYNKTAGYVDFNRVNHTTQYLKYPEIQKNWVPFLFNKKLLFFQSMNPVHVVRVRSRAMGVNSDSNFAVVETFAKNRKVQLPWNGTEYGHHIRGGTPAIPVKGVLFALFHTQLMFIKQWATYFMGAIAYCPHPPFHIHSISTVPILKKELYDGKWANDKYTNYVLFPMGVVLDSDNEHILVSMGYQDRHAYVVKLHIDGLFNNMQVLHNCSVSQAHADQAKQLAAALAAKAEAAAKESQALLAEAQEAQDAANAAEMAVQFKLEGH